MSRQLLYQITTPDLVPFIGQESGYLISRNSSIVIGSCQKIGPRWLETCFLEQLGFTCSSGLIVETCVNLENTLNSPAILFFIYAAANQTYFAFQIRQDSIYALVTRLNSKCSRYRQKEEKYRLLSLNPIKTRYQEWKAKSSIGQFLAYAIYAFWQQECQDRGWDTNNYDQFVTFRQACYIGCEADTNNNIADEFKIKYGRHEISISRKKWLVSCKDADYEEWQRFCLWKKMYYTQRCLYFENNPEITWLQVAKCCQGANLSFFVSPTQVIWYIDGYRVYTWTPVRPLCRINVGLGLGCCNYYQERSPYLQYQGDLCSFGPIHISRYLLPIESKSITTNDPTSETDSEDIIFKRPPPYCPPRCPPPPCSYPQYESCQEEKSTTSPCQTSCQIQPYTLNSHKKSLQPPLEIFTHSLTTPTENNSLSITATTSSLASDDISLTVTETSTLSISDPTSLQSQEPQINLTSLERVVSQTTL